MKTAVLLLFAALPCIADPLAPGGVPAGAWETTYAWQAEAGDPVFPAGEGYLTLSADGSFLIDPARCVCTGSRCDVGYCVGTWSIDADGTLELRVITGFDPVVARYRIQRDAGGDILLAPASGSSTAPVRMQPPG